MQGGEQPIYILPSDANRTTGREAQRLNIAAAKLVAETVRSTLGPKGMDKMIVDGDEITVTNDGVTILERMRIQHPTAKMLVEIAKTQEDEVGDGTTTAVVLAGEMLKRAEALLENGIHPTIIARGYRLAAAKAQELLTAMAAPVTANDKRMLIKVAHTAMTGKGAEDARDHLAAIVVDALLAVDGAARTAVKIEECIGAHVDESALLKGIVLDKERVHPSMPRSVEKAKIALIDAPLEIRGTEIDAKITISDPEKLQSFLDMEEAMLKRMVDKVIASRATVLISQKGIDDLAQHQLAKQGIYALRRVKRSDMERLAKATGGEIITNLNDLDSQHLGTAGLVEERPQGDVNMTYVEECPAAQAVTILVKGGTEHVVQEAARAVEDAIGDVSATIREGKAIAGAAAAEMELARGLHEYAATLTGREQLAVKAFADSLEIIPTTLAENAGIDPIDVLTALKAAHESGEKHAGIDLARGKKFDAWKGGVIEPLKIKTQAISSATEVATMILRIDDVIVPDAQEQPAVHQPPRF